MNEQGLIEITCGQCGAKTEVEIPWDMIRKRQQGVAEFSIPWTCTGCGREDILQDGLQAEWK